MNKIKHLNFTGEIMEQEFKKIIDYNYKFNKEIINFI